MVSRKSELSFIEAKEEMMIDENQIKNFVSALKSYAMKFGLKSCEWQFKMVDLDGKRLIEKECHHTVWISPEKGTLADFYIGIRKIMPPSLTEKAVSEAINHASNHSVKYLIAYCN